jgi:hypothetical protein|nr:MAG TPA: Uracil DNA glycosylase X [Crassvirales sp.]
MVKQMLPKVCNGCPLSITNKKPFCKNIGNPNSGSFIVLPQLEKSDKGDISNNRSYNIIKEIYEDLFNCDIREQFLITSLVRCAPFDDNFVNEEIATRCFSLLYGGVRNYRPNVFILFGNSGSRIIGKSPTKDNIVYTDCNAYYFTNYNPLSMLYDNTKIIFKRKLIQIFYAIDSRNLSEFQIKTL